MTIKEILSTGLINKAELARKLWPTKKGTSSRLEHKIAETNKQRLTEKDIDSIKSETVAKQNNI